LIDSIVKVKNIRVWTNGSKSSLSNNPNQTIYFQIPTFWNSEETAWENGETVSFSKSLVRTTFLPFDSVMLQFNVVVSNLAKCSIKFVF